MQGRPFTAVFAALALSANAWSADYIYDFVADSTGPAQAFGPPTINAGGNVVMSVNLDLGGQDIYRGTSVPLDIIAQTGPPGGGQFVSFGNAPGMNGNGLVAFTATHPGGVQALYTDNGGPSTLIVDSLGQFSGFGTPTVNNAGQIAFLGTLDVAGGGVYRATPGVTVTPIAQTSGPYSSFPGEVALSSDGYLLFRATLDVGGVDLVLSNGESPETMASTNDSDYAAFSSHAMSPGGVMAFAATHLDGTQAVYMMPTHDTPPEMIAHSDGVFQDFLTVAVNDNQQVAFLATGDEGGLAGIYTGCDPEQDAVVEVGDVINGHEIVGLTMGTRAISDDGHVVFVAFYQGGERGLYVAIPDPTAVDPPPPPPPQSMAGDLDGDGDVDGIDLASLLAAWGKCPPQPAPLPCIPSPDLCPGDLNDSGAINGLDLAMLLAAWTGPGRG